MQEQYIKALVSIKYKGKWKKPGEIFLVDNDVLEDLKLSESESTFSIFEIVTQQEAKQPLPKKTFEEELIELEVLKSKQIEALLESKFDSIESIFDASLTDLVEVPGISKAVAKKLSKAVNELFE